MVFNHLTCPTFYRRRIGLRKDATNSCGGRGSSEQDIEEGVGWGGGAGGDEVLVSLRRAEGR